MLEGKCLSTLPNPPRFDALPSGFHALADPLRVQVLDLLRD